jgi:DNA-binding winged helix-turn-helix (wHTH) protein
MPEPPSRSRDVLEFGPFQFGVDDVLLRRGAPVALSPKESAVLRLLAAAGGAVVDKDTLVDRVWAGAVVGDASLARCVHHLRQRLGRRADGEEFIETFYGRGYRLTAPVRRTVRDRLMVVGTAPTATAPPPQGDALLEDVEELLLVRGHDVFSLVLSPRTPAADIPEALAVARARGAHLLGVVRGVTTGAASSLALQVIRTEDGITLHECLIDGPSTLDATRTTADAVVAAILGVIRQRTQVQVPQRLLRTMQTEPRVYEAYFEARALYKRRNPVSPDAVRLYKQALAWDAAYIPALLGLAECYLTLASWSVLDPNQALALAEPLIRQVESLDPSATGLLVLQAMITSGTEWRFEEAERLFRRALEEDGADTNAFRMYSRHLLHAGCPSAASQALRTCIDLDPRPWPSPIAPTRSGVPGGTRTHAPWWRRGSNCTRTRWSPLPSTPCCAPAAETRVPPTTAVARTWRRPESRCSPRFTRTCAHASGSQTSGSSTSRPRRARTRC